MLWRAMSHFMFVGNFMKVDDKRSTHFQADMTNATVVNTKQQQKSINQKKQKHIQWRKIKKSNGNDQTSGIAYEERQ